MKRRLFTIALAALTIGLLGSCSKMNERIDGLDQRVGNIENEKIASIENQIAAINSSIADLGTIRQDILDLQVAVGAKGEDITELKAADEALGQRIDELQTYVDTELAKYATTEWANATFATLEKLNETSTALSALEEKVDKLGETFDGKLSDLKTELTNAITSAIDGVNASISALEARVSALEQMIQTVAIVPAYNDGSVESTKDGVLYLDIIVTPAEAVATLTKDSLKVLVNEVKTKAVDVDTVAVTKFKVDAAKGTITARADISSVLPEASGKALTIAVNVKNGISDFITEFYPVTLSTESNVTITDETEATKVSIKDDEDFPESVMGNIGVAEGFKDTKPTSVSIPMPSLKVGGIGTVTFNETATAKIKANAEGSTNVFFKVEDVTTTKPVKNADVVLEVTMKTVDENGKEVFNKNNAEGEVTIQIPMDENVAYVNSVTLVNDTGEPIEGGVVPGSEEIENGILTFKVNHFSKYAVDYVTTADFVSVTGVRLDKTSATVEVGDTLRLVATIAPEDATNKKVTWSSDKTEVATVDATGKVTAVAFGEATITVTTKDGGKIATCKVKVTETKTMVDILGTNTGIPESEDMTPPAKAWVKKTDKECKAFVGVDEGEKLFVLEKITEVDTTHFGLCMNDVFDKIDETTYKYVDEVATVTVKMTGGKFTSCECEFNLTELQVLNGTYASPVVILPDGALKGGFSVSATKTVYFSKGNMYWDGDSFEFEANQYDSQSIWDTTHVSHFFWSKNASVAYAKEYSESGTTKTDVFFTNEEQETAKADFTVNGVAGKYRTLSKDEWGYLVWNRKMTNGGSGYEKTIPEGITIEGVLFKGVVLFPDDFTDQETWKTKYTTWEALNSAGLVFLPAAGYRLVSEFITVDRVGKSIGEYWTSSPDGPINKVPQAKCEYFSFEAFNVGYTDRNKGCCIRLVTEGD